MRISHLELSLFIFYMTNQNNFSKGIGFTGVSTVTFIILKLTNYITWSWWWVLSPIWINIVITLIILLLLYICFK